MLPTTLIPPSRSRREQTMCPCERLQTQSEYKYHQDGIWKKKLTSVHCTQAHRFIYTNIVLQLHINSLFSCTYLSVW